MKRCLLFLCALILLASVSVSAKSFVYLGGQLLVPGGGTDGIGGGSLVQVGKEISPKVIGWFAYGSSKTEEATDTDNMYLGFTYKTDYVVPPHKVGLFLTVEGGTGRLESEDFGFAGLSNAGFYWDVSEKSTLWVGGIYSKTKSVITYSANLGLSIGMDW